MFIYIFLMALLLVALLFAIFLIYALYLHIQAIADYYYDKYEDIPDDEVIRKYYRKRKK